MGALPDGREAARAACVSPSSAEGLPFSRWFRAVRLTRAGEALEPASGTFDAELRADATDAERAAALDAVPDGGCVLLRPGEHVALTVHIAAHRTVYVFGRGAAVVVTATPPPQNERYLLRVTNARATIDGVTFRPLANDAAVFVTGRSHLVLTRCVVDATHIANENSLHKIWCDRNVVLLRMIECRLVGAGNKTSVGVIACLDGAGTVELVACDVSAFGVGVSVFAFDHRVQSHVTLASCNVHHNETGVQIHSYGVLDTHGGLIRVHLRDNTIQDNSDIGVSVEGVCGGAVAVLEGNRVQSNRTGLRVKGPCDVDVTGTAFHANASDVRTHQGAAMPIGFNA